MKVTQEMNWWDILDSAWGQAEETARHLEDADMGNEFVALMEEVYPDGIDRTTLNDIMAFDDDWVYESLGMKNPYDDDEDEEDDE